MPSFRGLARTDKAIVALCAAGSAFMGYLVYLHFKTSPGTLCNFGAGFSCEIVNKSVYSELFGIPLSIMGLAYFIGVGYLAITKHLPHTYRTILALTAFSLVFSLHLTYVEFFVLGSVCLFCEASKLVMFAILGLSAPQLKYGRVSSHLNWVALAIIAGAVFTGAASYLQTAT
ncbi:MAG: hypothetical protein RL272_1189 [Candidatus Parcubacteria bacterium]